MTPLLTVTVIMPARIKPRDMARNAFLLFNFNILAIRVPVQAPVVGKGILTNIKSPIKLYFFISLDFFMDLSFNFPRVAENNLVFSKYFIRGFNTLSKIKTIMMFPIMLIIAL